MPGMICGCSKDKVFYTGTCNYVPGYDSFVAHHHLSDDPGVVRYLYVYCVATMMRIETK